MSCGIGSTQLTLHLQSPAAAAAAQQAAEAAAAVAEADALKWTQHEVGCSAQVYQARFCVAVTAQVSHFGADQGHVLLSAASQHYSVWLVGHN
jgi:hypothetical protein